MVDHTKRNTLKAMTAAATVAAVPTTFSGAAVAASAENHANLSAPVDSMQTHMSGLGLEIEVEPIAGRPTMWVRFSNVCDKPVQLRQISPGLVRSNGKLYDVNTALAGQSLTIDPDNAYSYMIEPIDNEIDALVHGPGSKISPLSATVTGPDSPAHGDVLTPRLILS